MSQREIDGLSYPENHQYTLEPLEPIGTLKERLELMPKNFFKGNSFLDIGCNKGFFTLYADCNYIESIDNEEKYTDLCSKLSKGIAINTSFREYRPIKQFDRIFIGNTHHYIFKECGGWEWINKLAAISNDLVLIEGPTGLENSVADKILEDELRGEFTKERFMTEMGKHFTLISDVDSPYSTRHRSIMLFKRKSESRTQLSELKFIEQVHENDSCTVYHTNDSRTAKILKNPNEESKIRINIAKTSPISNGLLSEIYDNDRFVGWLEKYDPSLRYRKKENEVELFKLICKHNIYLAKLGYTDTDTATSNFFKNSNKLFDKGQVVHISQQNKMYEIQLRNSYDIISDKIIDMLVEALLSKNSKLIETMYQNVLKAL